MFAKSFADAYLPEIQSPRVAGVADNRPLFGIVVVVIDVVVGIVVVVVGWIWSTIGWVMLRVPAVLPG